MEGRGRRGALVAVAAGVVLAWGPAACGSAARPERTPVAPAPGPSSTEVTVPRPAPDLGVVYRSSVSSGSSGPVTMTVRSAPARVDVNCQGPGTLVVRLAPGGSFEVPCPAGAVNSSRNQVALERSGVVVLQVSAPATVRWAAIVQQ